MTTRMLRPRVQPRMWRMPTGPEPVAVIRVDHRCIGISIEHARELADALHDLADAHEHHQREQGDIS